MIHPLRGSGLSGDHRDWDCTLVIRIDRLRSDRLRQGLRIISRARPEPWRLPPLPEVLARVKKKKGIITKVRVKDNVREIHPGGGGDGTFGDLFGSALTNEGADSGAAQQLKRSNERTERQATFPPAMLAKAGPVTPKQDDAPTAAPESKEPRKGMATDEVGKLLGAARSSAKNGPVEARSYPGFEVDYVNEVAVDVRKRAAGAAAGATVRKGMSPEDVEAIAGKPIETKTNGELTTHKYKWQDGTLEADFFNGCWSLTGSTRANSQNGVLP